MNASHASAGRWTVPRPARGLAAVWMFALLAYVVGDVLTTAVAVWGFGLVELSPTVGPAIATFGAGGLLAVKAVVLVWCLGVSAWGVRADGLVRAYGPPVFLAVTGAIATASNAALLL